MGVMKISALFPQWYGRPWFQASAQFLSLSSGAAKKRSFLEHETSAQFLSLLGKEIFRT